MSECLRRVAALVAILLVAATACSKPAPERATPSAPATKTAGESPASSQTGALPHINAARSMQYTREIVALGPRPLGSANHKKVEQYIKQHLQGAQVEDDAFTATTPAGALP